MFVAFVGLTLDFANLMLSGDYVGVFFITGTVYLSWRCGTPQWHTLHRPPFSATKKAAVLHRAEDGRDYLECLTTLSDVSRLSTRIAFLAR